MSLAVEPLSLCDPYVVFAANEGEPKRTANKLMQAIFSNLSWKEVVRAAGVCKDWRRLAIVHSYNSHSRRQFVPLNIRGDRSDEFSLVYKDVSGLSMTPKRVHVRKDMAYVHYQEQRLVAWSLYTKQPLHTWDLPKELVWLQFFKMKAVSFNGDNSLSVYLLDEPSGTRQFRVACPSDLKAGHVAIWNDMIFILTPSQILRVDTSTWTVTGHNMPPTSEKTLFGQASLNVMGDFLIVRTPNDSKRSDTISTNFTVSAIDLKKENETCLSSKNFAFRPFQHDKRPFVVLDSKIIDVQTNSQQGLADPNTLVNYDKNSKSLVTFTEVHEQGHMEKDVLGHVRHYGGAIYRFFNFLPMVSKMSSSYMLYHEAGSSAFGSTIEQYGPYALCSGPCDGGATDGSGSTSSSVWESTTSMFWSKETKLLARVKKMERNSSLLQGKFLSWISEGERHVGIKVVNLAAPPFILAHQQRSLWQRARDALPF